MRYIPTVALLAAVLALAAPAAGAQGFSFSTPDDSAKREREAREARIGDALSTPCRRTTARTRGRSTTGCAPSA
jgi:hypothetical protein